MAQQVVFTFCVNAALRFQSAVVRPVFHKSANILLPVCQRSSYVQNVFSDWDLVECVSVGPVFMRPSKCAEFRKNRIMLKGWHRHFCFQFPLGAAQLSRVFISFVKTKCIISELCGKFGDIRIMGRGTKQSLNKTSAISFTLAQHNSESVLFFCFF